MNLYEFVDNWLKSNDCPARYQSNFTKQQMIDSLSRFSDFALKEPLSDKLFDQAYNACGKYFAAKKSGKVEEWHAFPEAKKLKDVELGMAAWEGYSLSDSEAAALKEMFLSGIYIITQKHADTLFNNVDSRGHYESPFTYALQVVQEKDSPTVFVAIDNSTNDAWTEEFKSLEAARAWLDGASLDEVQEKYSDEKQELSLQELCDEPIVGETVIAGIHIVVDPNLTNLTYNEAVNYIDFVEKQKIDKNARVTEIILKPESGDNISIDWTVKPLPFNRIRRITGYLVGDLNRWNNAKKQEEHDRVKHTSALAR